MASAVASVIAETITMRAIVQEGSGSAEVLHLRDIGRPAVPVDGVLVRVHAASVNASDYHVIRGGLLVGIIGRLLGRKRDPAETAVPGGDVAGTIVEVGKDVTTLRPGDEVFGVARGAWAEYALGSERGLLPKPARLSFVEAATLGVAPITALQGLRDIAGVRPGQRVLVYGAGGGVGTFAVQIAKALGAHVTAVTGPRSIDLVRPLGADVLVDYTKEDVAKRPERYDVIYDVAAIRSIGTLRRMLAPGGLLVMAGAAKKGGWGLFARLGAAIIRGRLLKQRVVFYMARIRRDDLAYLAALVEAGKLRPVIERTYPLSETREAVRYTMTGQARAKVVIEVS